MTKHSLQAEERKITGRKVKKLRNGGLLPANIYGKDVKSLSVQIKLDEFNKLYKEAGETGLIELSVGKDVRPVLVHNLQKNPITDLPVHVDFFQVNLKEKVTTMVPVELTGESPAEKQSLGTVVTQLSEIEVEALPADLPEKFVVDISNLTDVDQAVHVKDLDYNKEKVEIKSDVEAIVAKVEPPQKIEEAPVPAPVEGEVTTEGEAPASGEAAPEGEAPAPTEEKAQ